MKEISEEDVLASAKDIFPRNGPDLLKLILSFGQFVDRMNAAGAINTDNLYIDKDRLASMTRDELEEVARDALSTSIRLLAAGIEIYFGAAKESIQSRRSTAAKGGKAKAAHAKPNPEKQQALELALLNPGLSALQIKGRAKLRASERTIRGWISATR